ncbi:MAG: hypothetical protein A2087_03585 [Spirochaetes bacterium GWD1_61_31]|nr:MAG: hypothetical protein A2Y37_12545 [Spirochaetes bacterium GWB1_60_80]OHD30425.1 MAG: hypothetical protein A2004_11425 [Spirochaetes bacterium GWC1_61_12]OHD36173.1 MAG: hypothetical protein A2087_03585 [Spirochaetes bacterium GWD1_61_31]OHD43237.1 MAG: hypothetical protein A2Y35_08405 [Spirochaetes bacterium GWE1_60_18]OHD58797.1 MAG: hypothetical protein A2Y32_01240 [Spirochaetes bacterium GWF1_60_12]HAP43320.1 hypothetical protein [Spirochaetaceae bacterium]
MRKHRISTFALVTLVALCLANSLALSSCSTLSVTTPPGWYLSTGDYQAGIRTEGIIQVQKTVWTPFFVLYDANKVRADLYEALIAKVAIMPGMDGITNITFHSKPSPLCILTPFTLGLGVWVDFYAEGVVITHP